MKYLCLAGGVSPRSYSFTTWRERSDWTRHSGVTVFPSARGSKNRYPAEGASPRGYWYTVWRERSDWTRTSEAKIFRAREEPSLLPSAILCCSGLEPDGAWSRRPSACVWRSGYWFEPEEQIKQEPPRRSLEGSCFIRSPDWTRTSNPSINSRMLCQLSYGGLLCFSCWFPLQRVITIPGLFGLRNLKCYEVHHFWVVWLVWVVKEASTPRYSPATCRTQDIRQAAGA